MGEQLELLKPACKSRGCEGAVVGSSITGAGHVCKRHNEAEWGSALSCSRDRWHRELGVALLKDAHDNGGGVG
jgi:hypothetical protein